VTVGPVGLSRAAMQAMPALKLVLALGAGMDAIDLAAARERGVTVANGSGTNAASVADHAIGMALALLRNIVAGDRAIRIGKPAELYVPRPILTAKRVGICGLGAIGTAIAKRAAAFDTTIAYHNRNPRPGAVYRYCASLAELASVSDVLFVATPGGPATEHLVNESVLEALGPGGRLVNVGRGSVVDTAALVRALQAGTIAGAALDVFEDEPHATPAMLEAPNLILTPHIGGLSPEALAAAHARMFQNLAAFFAGRDLVGKVL
jgi:lactate dehydrogenase-like 2-hydroxyacid dehydrogenase